MPPVIELTLEQRALYDKILHRMGKGAVFRITNEDGRLAGPFSLMVLTPAVGDCLFELGEKLRFATTLSARQVEIGILTIARHTHSAFEAYAHTRIAARVGLAHSEIAALLEGNWTSADPRETAVAALAAAVCGGDASSQLRDSASASALDPRAVAETVALASFYRMLALLMAAFDIQPPDDSEAARRPNPDAETER